MICNVLVDLWGGLCGERMERSSEKVSSSSIGSGGGLTKVQSMYEALDDELDPELKRECRVRRMKSFATRLGFLAIGASRFLPGCTGQLLGLGGGERDRCIDNEHKVLCVLTPCKGSRLLSSALELIWRGTLLLLAAVRGLWVLPEMQWKPLHYTVTLTAQLTADEEDTRQTNKYLEIPSVTLEFIA